MRIVIMMECSCPTLYCIYNTRSAAKQSYYLPKARTHYGKFNIRFQGPKIWNSIDDKIKAVSLSQFKSKIKQHYLSLY